MLIKPEDINKVLELSGNAVSTRGKKYFEKSKVKVAKLDMEDDENGFFDDINSYFGWCENIHWLTCKYINEHPDDFKRVGL